MPTKNVRIDVNAENIAMKYGSSVSKGIFEMEYKLNNPTHIRSPICNSTGGFSSDCSSTVGVTSENSISAASLKFSSTPVPDIGLPPVFNEAYWKKVKETIEAAIDPHVGR